MRLQQTLGRASAHQVVVRVQLRGSDGVEVRECPAPEFEPSDRGVAMGSVFVPWARIFRYDTIVEQGFIPEGGDHEAPTIQRVVFEDESGVARSIEVPIDRYEAGPWTLTVVMDRDVDRRRGTMSIRKVCIPWARVIETERIFKVADAQPGGLGPASERRPEPSGPDPTVKEWFERASTASPEDGGSSQERSPAGADEPMEEPAGPEGLEGVWERQAEPTS